MLPSVEQLCRIVDPVWNASGHKLKPESQAGCKEKFDSQGQPGLVGFARLHLWRILRSDRSRSWAAQSWSCNWSCLEQEPGLVTSWSLFPIPVCLSSPCSLVGLAVPWGWALQHSSLNSTMGFANTTSSLAAWPYVGLCLVRACTAVLKWI